MIDQLTASRFVALAATLIGQGLLDEREGQGRPCAMLCLEPGPPPVAVPVFATSASAADRATVNALIAGWSWTQTAQDAWSVTDQRSRATALLADPAGQEKLLRAVLLVLLDELNALREWLTSFKAATAAATTLADLKVRVAALPAMPDRTAAQARSAVAGKITDGSADT